MKIYQIAVLTAELDSLLLFFDIYLSFEDMERQISEKIVIGPKFRNSFHSYLRFFGVEITKSLSVSRYLLQF